MARENQGLQIALIVFVVLTIMLGVSTFFVYRKYDEERIKAEQATSEAHQKGNEASARNIENLRLKEMMGFGEKEDLPTMEPQFTKDMTEYAGAFADEHKHYRPLVKQLFETIDSRNTEIASLKSTLRERESTYEAAERTRTEQIAAFSAAQKQAGDELISARNTFNQDLTAVKAEQEQMAASLGKARSEGQEAVAKVEEKLTSVTRELAKVIGEYRQMKGTVDKLAGGDFDVHDGEIRWVNQRNATVWINLGRADQLAPRTSFSVFGSDVSNLTGPGKKASIEVTQILDDHLAEARVVDDEVTNPIMPGDKIFTPIWDSGDKKHVGLTGMVDLDDDGRSDIDTLRRLIEINGGVVDAYTDEKGEKHGEMTVYTKYLVVGDEPSGSSVGPLTEGFSKMQAEAERLDIEALTVKELLHRMGWKNQTPVIQYGMGANPKDFSSKPADGAAPESTGNTFRPRVPPRVGAARAY